MVGAIGRSKKERPASKEVSRWRSGSNRSL